MTRAKKDRAARRRVSLHDTQGKYDILLDLYSPQQRQELLELVKDYEDNSPRVDVFDVDQFCEENVEHDRENFRRRLNRRVHRTLSRGQCFTSGKVTTMTRLSEMFETLERLAKNSRTAQYYLQSARSTFLGWEAMLAKDYRQAAIHYSNAFKFNPNTPIPDTLKDNVEAVKGGFIGVARNTKEEAPVRAAAFHVLAMLQSLAIWQSARPYCGTADDLTEMAKSSVRYVHLCQLLVPHDGDYLAVEGDIIDMLGRVRITMDPDGNCCDIWRWLAIRAYTKAEELGCSQLALNLLWRSNIHPCPCASMNFLDRYVSLSEVDDRFYPLACYQLATRYGLMGRLGQGRYYYDLGMKSMEKRLPIFDADEFEEFRQRAAGLVGKYHCCSSSNCLKLGTLLCSRCKEVYYCSSECEQQAWGDHKKECENVGKKFPS
ncbi:hypothetical protein ACHAWF_014771 [Thalassiosira exigua]